MILPVYILIAPPFIWLAMMITSGALYLMIWRRVVADYEIADRIDPDIKRAVNWFDHASPFVPAIWGVGRNFRVRRHLNRLALYGAPAPELVGEDVAAAISRMRRILLPFWLIGALMSGLIMISFFAFGAQLFSILLVLPYVLHTPPPWPATSEIKERIARCDQSA